MDSTFYDFLEVEVGGYGPLEPPQINHHCTNPPYPRTKFNFLSYMATNRPWLAMDAIAVPSAQHPLPKHLEKVLPKFYLDNGVTTKDHIKQCMIYLRLMDVQHEDVVCRLFPYTFVGQAFTWFLSLTTWSIESWEQFESSILSKFGDDRTSSVLF